MERIILALYQDKWSLIWDKKETYWYKKEKYKIVKIEGASYPPQTKKKQRKQLRRAFIPCKDPETTRKPIKSSFAETLKQRGHKNHTLMKM